MKKKDYEVTVNVPAPAKEVFKAIGQVSKWWAPDIEGRPEKLNGVFTVRFGDTFVTFKVTEVVPVKKLVWHVTDCNLHWITHKKEWTDTTIVFDLSTQGKGTQIRFTHVGLVPNAECYSNCSTGWDHYIKRSLPSLITTGKGLFDKE